MKADMKGHLGSTDDTNGEERRGECWAVVTLQAYAETTSHTLRHSAMGNLTMEDCGLLRKRVNRDAKKRQPDKNTQVAQRRLVTVNETCSDFI
ncbi:hypothetical protein T03_14299 [Trichinella britovi]|uniref:Uncharacterized protein n=1 Tax=Trichinella britovi TaxID=45882 RepID=A0A0V1AKJ1_TRIBR|nr:hypothetical protein T03_14299 [Trichinella britovi]